MTVKLNEEFEAAVRKMLEGSEWRLTEDGKIVRREEVLR